MIFANYQCEKGKMVVVVIDQNISEFQKANILTWQKDNFGENTTIIVLDEGFTVFPHMADQVEILDFGYPENDGSIGHGMPVMSIGYEIAPKAKIIYLPFNSVTREYKHKMIDWIIENKNGIDAISMSVVWTKVTASQYFDRLKDIGIPFFVASGNDGDWGDGVRYPATEEYTIAVGAYHDGTNSLARYTNGGIELDCVGFSGTHMYNSNGDVINQVGTSFSTPFVAFATLLYISWRKRNGLPKLTNSECIEWIKTNALDLKEIGFDNPSGWGMFRLPSEIPQVDVVIEEPIEGDDDLEFKDMQGHWAEQYVDFVSEKGIMTGFPDETFKPDNVMTRAEVATVIARMLGFEIEKK